MHDTPFFMDCNSDAKKLLPYIYPAFLINLIRCLKSRGFPQYSKKKFTVEEDMKDQRTVFLTSTLEGGVRSRPRCGRCTPEESVGTHCMEGLGRPQCRSGRVRKVSPPAGRRSIPRPSSQFRVAVPTTLSGPMRVSPVLS